MLHVKVYVTEFKKGQVKHGDKNRLCYYNK